MENQQLNSYLSNISTKIKSDISQSDNESSKDFHEELINYKLSLRKNKINNKLMEIRLKKLDKSTKITNRQKLYEYKKLFEINKIKQTKEKFLKKDPNFLKDKKFIELVHLYSQNINHDENIQKIFDLNDTIILKEIFNEIIKDINSSLIDLELFDYYLLILGNFFIYTKNIYENDNKDFINLFLDILNKNANLEIYDKGNFDVINDTLWLIHLYIYFNKNNYINHFSYILQNITFYLSNNFLKIMSLFYEQKKNDKLFFSIIKEIIYSLLNIFSAIFEEILDNINIIPNSFNLPNEIIQNSFDNLLNILYYKLVKDIYDENITDILALIFSINNNFIFIDISKNNFFEVICLLFDKFKYEDYENNKIIQNLIIILNKLIDNYYNYDLFWQAVKDSDILPICIQYYLKNGSLINLTLITLNLFFKYQINYNKIIIKCINYKLIEIVVDILINTENNEKNCYHCINLLLNSYYFLKTNMKKPEEEKIAKYFNINNGLISKLEQLLLSNDKYLVSLASELLYKFKNDDKIKFLFKI